MKLSFTTIALNERNNVDDLVGCMQAHVDEIVIVDTGSNDGTVERLTELGCTVVPTTMANGFSAARNRGLERCSGDWVLMMDFDERPSDGMLDWIEKFIERAPKTYNAVAFQRQNTIDGELLSEELHVRLFRRHVGRWDGIVHESVQYTGRRYTAPQSIWIQHDKTTARQHACNMKYLQFYPKLNLGSGGLPMPVAEGWVNYDLNPDAPDAVPADVFEELPAGLPAAHISAYHVLEHASYHVASHALHRWIDKLAPGGTIDICVPDIDAIIRDFVNGTLPYLNFLQGMYGGQATELDYHKIGINEGWLTGQLSWWGMVDIKREKPTKPYELRMTARKPL